MEKIIKFEDGIISGDIVREVIFIFPELENKFLQRKHFDEYYFSSNEIPINITIENIDDLTKLGLKLEINWDSITIRS
jgi:hypothetical protein